jgi:murein DD-endopeptidase MepM/ murein hydrolase activator NlpD
MSPSAGIQNGSVVIAGQVIGTLQSLQKRYPGITDHSHVELRERGELKDPAKVIP